MDVRKDVLATLHTPTIYILGGPNRHRVRERHGRFQRASRTCRSRWPICPSATAARIIEPNGGAAASVAVSWLDWQLRGDKKSAERFVGENCGLCRDAQWTLERKQFPAAVGH